MNVKYQSVFLSCLVAINLCGCGSRNEGNQATAQEAPSEETLTEKNITTDLQTMIPIVVDDSTGEILGEMVNQVGDYYIINPGNEEFIPISGHSIREISLDDYNTL